MLLILDHAMVLRHIITASSSTDWLCVTWFAGAEAEHTAAWRSGITGTAVVPDCKVRLPWPFCGQCALPLYVRPGASSLLPSFFSPFSDSSFLRLPPSSSSLFLFLLHLSLQRYICYMYVDMSYNSSSQINRLTSVFFSPLILFLLASSFICNTY